MNTIKGMRIHWLGFSRIVLRFLAVGCLAMGVPASPQNSATPNIPVIHATSDLVLLDAQVVNSKNNPPSFALNTGDFTLRENGVPQKILYCSRNQLPLSIVMLFDLTDTVQPKLTSLSAKAQDILSHLRPQDEVAVMTFSSTTQLIQPFTGDHRVIAEAIRKAAQSRSKEATFADEVVDQAASEAANATNPQSRRVLLFFTDGTTNAPGAYARKISPSAPTKLHTKYEAQQNLLEHGITVSALIERSVLTEASLIEENVNPVGILFSHALGYYDDGKTFQRYANLTGGPYLKANNADSAAQMIKLLDELHNRYTLGYRPSSPCAEGNFCRISLQFSGKAIAQHPELKANHFKINIRSGYYK